MIISNNWLKDYVAHDLEIDALSDLLTMAGLEVEGVSSLGSSLDGVVVGHVIETDPHPNADRLTLCRVDVGGDEPVSIVCGAKNVAPGQKVALATVGTVLLLPDRDNPEERVAITIKKSKLRGEESHGMICAEDELGVSSDHSGIMVLDSEAVPGTPISTYLCERSITTSDHAIDIAITPNRPDAVCHIGVARDVAAITGVPLSEPVVDVTSLDGPGTESFDVTIDAVDGCHRYVGILVRGITIGPSPVWMQQRLTTVGLRPRNIIVDITNYVMYEMGQPLHAFDFDRLGGAEIIVHQTSEKCDFTTLDGKERALPTGTLMIADRDGDVAIAGLMGGDNSEVTDETVNVLIESAYFDPSLIRRTAKALQLQTDASYRFERGIDPTMQARAAARAAHLMVELAGGSLEDGIVDVQTQSHSSVETHVRPSRVELLLGVQVPSERIVSLLEAIGFGVSIDGTDDIKVVVPAFRPDVTREVDVIEEVARLYGYSSIPEPSHSSIPNGLKTISTDRILRERARDLLTGLGYREVYTNSMLSKETAQRCFDPILPGARFGGDIVETLNPISQEMAALRPSLVPGVLSVAGYNYNRGVRSLRFFEFGRVHAHVRTEHSIVDSYTERETLLILLSGVAESKSWDCEARAADIFDLKGLSESILTAVGTPDISFVPGFESSSVTLAHLDIFSRDELIGVVAEVTPEVSDSFDLEIPAFILEIDWSSLSYGATVNLKRTYTPFSRYPVVERDLAVTVGRDQHVGPLQETIRGAGGPLLSGVRLFDLYEGDRIDSTLKSLAFSLQFSAFRTLRDKEVEKAMRAIVSAVESEHGAQLRS